jgi:hypothetical protein
LEGGEAVKRDGTAPLRSAIHILPIVPVEDDAHPKGHLILIGCTGQPLYDVQLSTDYLETPMGKGELTHLKERYDVPAYRVREAMRSFERLGGRQAVRIAPDERRAEPFGPPVGLTPEQEFPI